MGLVHHRVNAQACLLRRVMDPLRLGLIRGCPDLHRREAGLQGKLEPVHQRQLLGEHGVDDGPFDLAVRCRQAAGRESGGSGEHPFATVHSL